MNLSYNGVVLKICHFDEWSVVAEYTDDGADYLYSHVTIGVTCIFNPTFGTDSINPGQAPVGATTDKTLPDLQQKFNVNSIASLKQKLMMPRGQLFMDVGGTTLLSSPATVNNIMLGVDCANGPKPIDFKVISFHGTKSAIVHFAIETWINENALDTGEPAALLANRWTQTEDVSEDFLTTITTEGTAYFRADLLSQSNAQPDEYRSLWAIPTPAGFLRKNVWVQATSDGLAVEYSFTDEEQIWTLNNLYGLVRVKGRTRYEYDMADNTVGLFGLPKSRWIYSAEVWGRPACTRDKLSHALLGVMVAALNSQMGKAATGAAGVIGSSLTNRLNTTAFVEIDFPERHGSAEFVMVNNGIMGGFKDLIFGATFQQVCTQFYADFDSVFWSSKQRIAGVNPGPTATSVPGVHGDAQALVLSAILGTPGVVPEQPFAPGYQNPQANGI